MHTSKNSPAQLLARAAIFLGDLSTICARARPPGSTDHGTRRS